MPRVLSLLSVLTFAALLLHCKKAASFISGGLDNEAISYLIVADYNQRLYDSELKPLSIKEQRAKLARVIEDCFTQSELAIRHGLLTDEYYSDFLAHQKLTRFSKAAYGLWSQLLRPGFQPEEVLDYYQIRPRLNELVFLEVLPDNTVFAKHNEKELQLKLLKGLASESEWLQVKTDKGQKRKATLESLFKKYIAYLGHQQLMEITGSEESDFAVYDQCTVADLYLNRKYLISNKGMYPTRPIENKVPLEKLLYYYERKQKSITRPLSVQANLKLAKTEQEAEKLVDKGFSTKPKKIIDRDKLPFWDGFILDAASKMKIMREPAYRVTVKGIAVYQIYDIEYPPLVPPTPEVLEGLRYTYNRELLNERLPQDLESTRRKIHFKLKEDIPNLDSVALIINDLKAKAKN